MTESEPLAGQIQQIQRFNLPKVCPSEHCLAVRVQKRHYTPALLASAHSYTLLRYWHALMRSMPIAQE